LLIKRRFPSIAF